MGTVSSRSRSAVRTLPVLSLFSGCGGLDKGFLDEGFDPLLAIDHNKAAVATYRRNFAGTVVRQLDLSVLKGADLIQMWEEVSPLPPVGLIGGPPCQAFSQGNVSRYQDDPRRKLVNQYARLLRSLNRKFHLPFFVLENVPGLLSPRHKSNYLKLVDSCERTGFVVHPFLLDAKDFEVAQTRKRAFLIGLNQDLFSTETKLLLAKSDTPKRTVACEIRGFPEPQYFDRRWYSEEIPFHPNHWTMNPRSQKFLHSRPQSFSKGGRSFRVLDWDSPSWTVAYGNREVHIHPDGHRRLSVYEAMRLQGFPKDFVLEGTLSDQYRLVSDAVPPPLARAIAKALRELLSQTAATPRHAI
jgi:DNA (cytosine-5)-methyltransferase 1